MISMKEKNKKLKSIIAIMAIIIIVLCSYIVYDKVLSKNNKEETVEKNDNNNNEEEINRNIAFAVVKDNKVYGITKTGEVEELVQLVPKNDNSLLAFDKNRLYYISNNQTINSIDLKTKENKEYDITVGINSHSMYVNGDNVIISSGTQPYLYNLKTGKRKTLKNIVLNNMNTHSYKDIYFYSNAAAAYYYDINTGKTEKIAESAYIKAGEGSKIVYQKNNATILFDYETKKHTLVKKNTDYGNIGENITINNDEVYFISADIKDQHKAKLFRSKNGQVEALQEVNNFNYFHVEYGILKLSDNTLLIIEKGSKFEDCSTEDTLNCTNQTKKHYIYNIKENTLTESQTDYSMLNYSPLLIERPAK